MGCVEIEMAVAAVLPVVTVPAAFAAFASAGVSVIVACSELLLAVGIEYGEVGVLVVLDLPVVHHVAGGGPAVPYEVAVDHTIPVVGPGYVVLELDFVGTDS